MAYPENPAPTDVPILEAIRRRWSPVAFSSDPLTEQEMATLFEAARWAPSSYNEQPWRYVYAAKGDGAPRAALESLLMEGNAWAKCAPLLLISFAKSTFTRNGKENRVALHDLGCANGYIALQAAAMGLVTHQMAGFHESQAGELLGAPPDFLPGSMMAVGRPGDPGMLAPELRSREEAPRTRLQQQEFVFRGRFGLYSPPGR